MCIIVSGSDNKDRQFCRQFLRRANTFPARMESYVGEKEGRDESRGRVGEVEKYGEEKI